MDWDYAPSGQNLCFDDTPGATVTLDRASNFTDDQALYVTPNEDIPTIGSVYKKARYIEYLDGKFDKRVRRPETESLGILGPIFWAEVRGLPVLFELIFTGMTRGLLAKSSETPSFFSAGITNQIRSGSEYLPLEICV